MTAKRTLLENLSKWTGDSELAKKIVAKLSNDDPTKLKVRKAWRYATGRMLAPLYLSECSRVGRGARVYHRPFIENYGTINIGDNFNIRSLWIPAHLVTGPGGVIEIGNDVKVQLGVGICAYGRITIGDRCRIAPHVMILDSDFHSASDLSAAPDASPITIGNDVWLAYRVTVLRGSRIGDRSVITAGSVVSGDIPAGVIAGGNPARVLRRIETDRPIESVLNDLGGSTGKAAPIVARRGAFRAIESIEPSLVMRVREVAADAFQMEQPPPLDAGPQQIVAWDSLGQLRMSSCVEEVFGIELSADDLESIRTVGDIVRVVDSYVSSDKLALTSLASAPAPVPAPALANLHDYPRLAHEALLRHEAILSTKPAIVCDNRVCSYGDLSSRVRQLGLALERAGVKTSDSVLLLVADKVDYLSMLYATWLLGAVAVPIVDGAAIDTVREIAQTTGAKLLVVGAAELRRFDALRSTLEAVTVEDLDASTEPRSTPFAVLQASEPALVMFTSGTSAKKKAVVLTHDNIMQSTVNINEFTRIDSNIVEYVTVPLTHSFGLGRARCILSVGGTVVVHNGFLSPPRVVRAIREQRCNSISWVPAGFAMLSEDESALQSIGHQIAVMELGSAAMPLEQKEKLMRLFPNARICMHYGLTEASRSAFIEFHSEKNKLDTVGRPSPNVSISIRDELGSAVANGNEGEIVVSGRHVMVGYLGNDALNAASRWEPEAFRTGDYGYFDSDGYLHLLGRKDEMINSGGVKISPLEIEEKVRDCYPGLDCCVVGLASDNLAVGRVPVLVYVPREGTEITLETLSKQLHEKLDRNKFPKAVVAVESISKTSNGKIQRNLVRELLESQRNAV